MERENNYEVDKGGYQYGKMWEKPFAQRKMMN